MHPEQESACGMLDALHGSADKSSLPLYDSFKELRRRTGVVVHACKVIICFVSFNSLTYKIQTLQGKSAKMVRTNDPEVVWDKPNPVDDKWIEFIDDNVLRSALSSYTHGSVLCLLIFLRAPRR